ncbi:hypothetical protein [Actinomycetospora callitridis]|jgi:hypothetical protein|uniref:hypothetical protein n=1 Tax=Actinomycetospora callitridis TaxID=913944 RepID=UPI00236556E7|nr:hypothetical protein [Actinomycetospora callitridis]MDD7919404.1 hypothetical protein [Actinomycetospora callitridis]
MTRLQRLVAATALAGAGSLALSGVASASESHHGDEGHSTRSDHKGLVGGLVGAGGELAEGVGGLVGGVNGAVGSVLGSDAVGDVVDGLV